MSRVVTTVLTCSSNASSNDLDFQLVKNYVDNPKTSSSVKLMDEESDETTGLIVLDTDANKFNGKLIEFQCIVILSYSVPSYIYFTQNAKMWR